MRYELTKDLETGNGIIDGEHRQLFAAVNSLMDACAQGRGRATIEPTMNFLLNYVDTHFAHEEELHKKSGFENFEAHRQFHITYTKKLRELAAAIQVSAPTVSDLNNLNQHIALLVNHIRSTDKKLGAYLNSKA